MNKIQIYLSKRNKVMVDGVTASVSDSRENHINRYVSTILKNLESYGFTCSEILINALYTKNNQFLVKWYSDIAKVLKDVMGIRDGLTPMYPNFPEDVMNATEAELYTNAIINYMSLGTILPEIELKDRFPLIDNPKLSIIDLGSEDDFRSIFTNMLKAKSSISQSDKEILNWFVENEADILSLIPSAIPMKENLSYITPIVIEKFNNGDKALYPLYRTATDVLRLSVALSKGDVSLATDTHFISFNRKYRKVLLSLLENCSNIEEDMSRYKNAWVRLGERLHPGEYKQFKKANTAFKKIRNNEKIRTFKGNLELAFSSDDIVGIANLLTKRPGEFARNLDRTLRFANKTQAGLIVVEKFDSVAKNIATPILLQLKKYFQVRAENKNDLRVFFPKGSMAKAYGIENKLETIDTDVCLKVVEACEKALIENYKEREPLGKVFVDKELEKFIVPTSLRNASKSLKTVARGSRFTIDEKANIIRAFVYWKEPEGDRTDLDLSAVFYDKDFNFIDNLYYGNMKLEDLRCYHSGDETSAPNGATEYVDIDLNRIKNKDVAYVGIVVNSFTDTPFAELPECFVGFMERQASMSGEVYEPKTVKNKADITANSQMVMPVIIDVEAKDVVWTDMTLKNSSYQANNVVTNKNSIFLTMKAMLNVSKQNMYDLAILNVKARGELVDNREDADLIFALDEGITPYDTDIILAEYL